MTQSAIALTLGNITVRQTNGLFSLTDLHRASGGEDKHEPNRFIRLDQTRALLEELGKDNADQALTTVKGRNGGTYACRELVIAYAAWISAAFHLKVIRVFLAVTAPQPGPDQKHLDYTRISPAQAQDLKELVHAIAESKVQGYSETWARLQRKFRVNSYLELPAARFEEARAYLLAKLPQARAVPPGKMLVDRAKLAAIYIDLGKLQARIDAMGMPAQDTPPHWWQQQSISF